MSDKLPRRYSHFERAVLDPVLAFRLKHDPGLLEHSAAIIRDVIEATGREPRIGDEQRALVRGWLAPDNGFRLKRAVLEALNPRYRIRIRRSPRRELGRRGRLFRYGFTVTASAPIGAEPFVFRITAPDSSPAWLPASNQDAEFALNGGRPSTVRAETPPHGPRGFVDRMRLSPWARDSQPETWLATLAHENQRELIELLDSPPGQQFAAAVATMMSAFPANARGSDRFAVVAFDHPDLLQSDLSAFRIDRPTPTTAMATDPRWAVPLMRPEGSRVVADRGGPPMPMPSDEWLHLSDARVQDGGTVLHGDALVVYEDAADPRRDFVAGQWQTVFGSASHPSTALVELRPEAGETIDEGILLAGRNDTNWYHWLIEYLPRVIMAEDTIADDVPLIVTDRTPATGLEALRLLSGRKVLTIDSDRLQTVGMLHVVAPPSQVLDTTQTPWDRGISMNHAPLLTMRERILDTLGMANAQGQRLVYLERKSAHRGLRNGEALAQIASARGLDVVDPSTLSFAEQARLFTSSRLLVGASGAVMANYLFARPASSVLGLTSTILTEFVLPAAIANLAGAEFSYVAGRPHSSLATSRQRNYWIHSDFTVPPPHFEAALDEVMAGLSR